MANDLTNTGVICLVAVTDPNGDDGIKHIDVGNYFIDTDGSKCVITSEDYAEKYGHLIDVPIYVPRGKDHG